MLKDKLLRFIPVILICMFFVLLTIALIGQQLFAGYQKREPAVAVLDKEEISHESILDSKECLVLVNSNEEYSVMAWEDIKGLFEQMKVGADFIDISEDQVPDTAGYENVIMALGDASGLGETIYNIVEWVRSGGGLMIYIPPQGDYYFRSVAPQLGIQETGWQMYEVGGFRLTTDLLIGGEGMSFDIEDPFESSLTLSVADDCTVHMVSNDDIRLPLMWERDYGSGRIVFMNFGLMGKSFRGIYAAGYSLLGDVSAWPVINGSAFYLDDFISPVPYETSPYIQRDYGLSIGDFYTNVWWPDMEELSNRYGIYYTASVIEEYNNEREAPFSSNSNTQRFRYFGNSLLKYGGEIALHGYNHVPLCMEDFAGEDVRFIYERTFDYDYWETPSDMKASVEELIRFTQGLFPEETAQVYVPPSNILSEEARAMIGTDFPQIRSISGSYLESELEYVQEFEIADDGIVEAPRIISGYIIGPSMEIAALSELNLHYVNSHYQNLDDVLGKEEGYSSNWETMYQRLDEYMGWLYEAAPDIRNMTGSELAGAVQRYDLLDAEVNMAESGISIDLKGFVDEGWLLLRINEREEELDIDGIRGGEMTPVSGDLYLLKAMEDHVEIPFL